MAASQGWAHIGPYSFQWELDKETQETRWHILVHGMTIGVYTDSLDTALLTAISYKQTKSTEAAKYAWKMLKGEDNA